jgi:lipopolysaccharide/colanic/teichoic acid biosynthesis glycosyltransferase
MKRITDLVFAVPLLLLFSPVLLLFVILVWFQDFKSPIYAPLRVGKNGVQFRMFKIRSMIVNADASKVDSTSANDTRITKVGSWIRKFKIDELTQLVNVILGDMSLVGPRPNVERECKLYTDEELGLLEICPGITDISSIVFSDEGAILSQYDDPDLAYNQFIRPGKSRLGLLYVKKRSFWLDLRILVITATSILSRKKALSLISKLVASITDDVSLVLLSSRESELVATPPPGARTIVKSRN